MFKNVKMGTKVIGAMVLLLTVAAVIGTVGIFNIRKVADADTKLYEKMTIPLGQTGEIGIIFQRERVNVHKILLAKTTEEKQQLLQKIRDYRAEIEKIYPEYEKTFLDENDKKTFDGMREKLTAYVPYTEKIAELSIAGNVQEAEKVLVEATDAGLAAADAINKVMDYNLKAAKDQSDSNTKTANASVLFMTGSIAVGVLLCLAIGILFTRNVKQIIKGLLDEIQNLVDAALDGKLATRADPDRINFEFREIPLGVNKTLDAVIGPLNVAAEYVDRISKGDVPDKINESYNGDFNAIKNNLNLLIQAMNDVAETAEKIARGDLTVKIQKRSDKDKLMISIQDMVEKLSDIVQEVKDAADNVAAGSEQMSSTAEQMSQGASEQASAAEEASSSMEQMAVVNYSRYVSENTGTGQAIIFVVIKARLSSGAEAEARIGIGTYTEG